MKISEKKRKTISEQILAFLYSTNPKLHFTSQIAQEIARDEDFVKKILLELKNKNLVVEVKKNSKGVPYLRRSRWKLSGAVFRIYEHNQG